MKRRIRRQIDIFTKKTEYLYQNYIKKQTNLRPKMVMMVPCHVRRTVAVKLMPPLSFFLKPMFGGCLLSRIPKPSNSCSINFLWTRGFNTSSTIRIKLQVRATKKDEQKLSGVWDWKSTQVLQWCVTLTSFW